METLKPIILKDFLGVAVSNSNHGNKNKYVYKT